MSVYLSLKTGSNLQPNDLLAHVVWQIIQSSLQIADFGLSKWRQLSVSKGSGSKPTEMEGTVIYMPPEEYEPSKNRRADVKHDMYR